MTFHLVHLFPAVPTDPIPTSQISVSFSLDNSAVMIEWNNSQPAFSYEIEYSLTNQGDGEESVLVNADKTMVVISNLVNASDYKVCFL